MEYKELLLECLGEKMEELGCLYGGGVNEQEDLIEYNQLNKFDDEELTYLFIINADKDDIRWLYNHEDCDWTSFNQGVWLYIEIHTFGDFLELILNGNTCLTL